MITKTRLAGMSLIIALLALVVIPAGAQSRSLPFAAITQNQLVLYGINDTPTAIQLPGQYQNYGNPVWSPDGRSLVVTAADQNNNWQLIMIQPDGAQSTILIDGMPIDLPVSFTPEGHLLLTRETGEVAADPMQSPILEIYTASSAAPIASLGRVAFTRACGGGSDNPADWLYWDETNSGPGNSPRILALTPFGIVHSRNCTGRGVALLDTTTGTDTEIYAQLGWVKISPDGKTIAGIIKPFDDSSPHQLLLIDLATMAITELPVSAPLSLDQVFWGTTVNDLYYTTVVTTGEVPADAEEQQQLAESLGRLKPFARQVNAVEIHHLDLITNADITLYSGSAFALGRLTVMPAGAGILFSLIPNADRWVEAALAGDINPEEGKYGTNFLAIELYYLDVTSGAVSLIGTDMAQFAFNAGAYAAQ